MSSSLVAVAGATGIFQLPLQPQQAMLQEFDRLLALLCGHSRVGWIGGIEQLHQSCGQLLCCSPLWLAFEGMPVAVVDHQQLVQSLRCLAAVFGPLLFAGHWAKLHVASHPDAMQQRPRSPHTPIRWLHQLATLMAQVSQAERISPGDESLRARRLRQRMALAQRLLDPLPLPLRPNSWQETALWTALRWGGVGLGLGVWLHR